MGDSDELWCKEMQNLIQNLPKLTEDRRLSGPFYFSVISMKEKIKALHVDNSYRSFCLAPSETFLKQSDIMTDKSELTNDGSNNNRTNRCLCF